MSTLRDECWVVTGGAAGMENQCLGLAERLPLPIRTIRLDVALPWRWIAPYSVGSPFAHLKSGADILSPPWPRLLIGCGRQSIPFSIAIRRASGGRTLTVQCQDPRIDTRAFDLVVPPEHDGLTGPHVFPILGSPNRVTPAKIAAARADFAPLFSPLPAPRVAVLIGGNSRRHGRLDMGHARALSRMLNRAAQSHALLITTSRRTDPEVAHMLRNTLTGPNIYFWNGEPPNPYFGLLAWADAIVATSDSVNMILEAAMTGKPVHIFRLKTHSAIARKFHDSLAQRGIIRPFGGQIACWNYAPLDETGRAAAEIQRLLDARASAPDMRG